VAFEHHRHERARGDELDQLAEEGLALVLGVVLLGQRGVHGHELQRRDPQPLALEAGDDLAGQVTGEGVWLYEDQGAVHCLGSSRVEVASR
jgi:hypothetical protein